MPDFFDHKSGRNLDDLEKRLGYRFNSKDHLVCALTHASARTVDAAECHYERLEFLGDRVLGLCVAGILFERFPDADEGELSLRLNALVRGGTLAEIADQLALDGFIRTGGDLKNAAGKRMQNIRADVMEALIATVYLDGGMEAAKAMILRLWGGRFDDVSTARRDSKTALQEWAHSKHLGTPKYRETDRSGPDHEPVFTVEVKVSATLAGTGTGRSKRVAEQMAAQAILLREGVWLDD